MAALFASGHAADVILAALLLEALWLLRSRWPVQVVVAMLLPAALIVLGLRAALTGAEWPWIALPLALSFPAHLLDLALRTRR